jgi:hypothetical protein
LAGDDRLSVDSLPVVHSYWLRESRALLIAAAGQVATGLPPDPVGYLIEY